MSTGARVVVGIGAGVVLAGLGLLLGRSSAESAVPSATDATLSASTTMVAEPQWAAADGVRFLSTIVVPVEFGVGDGVATLEYELTSLGSPDGIIPPVVPESWRLTTVTGRSMEATTDPPRLPTTFGDDTVRPVTDSVIFDEVGDVTMSGVESLAVTGWRIATPVEVEVEMSSTIGSTLRLFDGVTIELATIIEQPSGSILDFDVTAVADPWHSGERSPFGRSSIFEGAGPGWASAASTFGGTGLSGGVTGFQLRRTGQEVPETISIRYTRIAWLPVPGETVVPTGGPDG